MWEPFGTAPKGEMILVRIIRDSKKSYALAFWMTWEERKWFRRHKRSGWMGVHGVELNEPFDEWMMIPA